MLYEILRAIEIIYKLIILAILLWFGYGVYNCTRGGLTGLAVVFTFITTILSPYFYFKIFPEDDGTVMGFVGDTMGLIIFTSVVLAFGLAVVLVASMITGEDVFTPYVPDF